MVRPVNPLIALPLVLLILLASFAVTAQEMDQADFVTFTFENDVFYDRDGGYTNGFGFHWAHGPFDAFDGDNIPRWAQRLVKPLYISTMPGKVRAVSYTVAQVMQTADDISIEELVPENAPYMGLALWRGTLYAFDERASDRMTLLLGIVGPASGAEMMQTAVHRAIGSIKPEGWDHQLDNEPVIRLEADRSWRLLSTTRESGIGADVIGFVQGGAGNLMSDVGAGMSLRIGHDLKRTFPAATIYPSRGINVLAGLQRPRWNAFINVMGSWVFNDISINGNTFSDSHRVDLVNSQLVATAGIAFNIGDWGFLFSTARGTDRYETQELQTRFGSLSVTYFF